MSTSAPTRYVRPRPAPHRSGTHRGADSGDVRPARRTDEPEVRTFTVSVVIPCRNEARNLPHVLRTLPEAVGEVILVDGRSTDGSVETAREFRPDVRVLHQVATGKGDALALGFAAASGDVIVMLDADGSTDGTEIHRFLAALVDGADFAKGSRFLPGGGSSDLTSLRAVGNRALVALVNRLYGTRYTDLCYGYNAFWRHCLDRLNIDCDGFEVETLIAIRAAVTGLRVVEVPSFELERIHGTSNLNAWRDGWRVLRTILSEWARGRRKPLP